MASLPADFYVKAIQFTKGVHRDQYPAIDPTGPELSLAGKVVIITGASRGIGGRGIVPAFAKAGAKALVLVARDETKLNAVAKEAKKLNADLETLVYPVDIADGAGIKTLFEKVSATYGHADVLVNNAAVMTALDTIMTSDPKTWMDDLTTNVGGAFYPTFHFLRSLPPTSHGTIVNVTTIAHWVVPGMSSYVLAKLASLQLAAYVAAETAPQGNVTAVGLHPGLVHTDMTSDYFRPFAQDSPALVGGTAVWLCSERARFLNGRFVAVNWDVEDLYERRREIVEGGLLKLDMRFRHQTWGPLDSLLGAHVEVVGPDELEHGVVVDGAVLGHGELVAVDELGQEDLDLLQGKVEADAHAGARREGDVRRVGAVLDLLRVPAVGVEAGGVVPDQVVVVNVVQGGDADGVLGQLVAAGEDHVNLGGAGWLVRGVVATLGLLDVLVEEGELLGEVGGDLGVLVKVVVDELLKQTLLHAGIGDDAVEEPGEEGGGGGEAGAGGDDEGLHDALAGQLVAARVAGAEDIVDHVVGLESGLLQLEVLGALGGVVDGLVHHIDDAAAGVAQALGVAEGQGGVPAAHGGDLLVELEGLGDADDHFMGRGVDGGEVLEVHAEDELADGLGAELEHVGIDVPCLVLVVELVKDLESILDGSLHGRGIVADSLGAEGGWEELVNLLPLRRVGVAKEDAGLLVLDGVEGVAGNDVLCEEVALGEEDVGEGRVVGVVDDGAHVVGLEERAVLLEEALVVAQVVWVDLEVVADEGEALGTGDLADGVAIDGDGDGSVGGEDVGDCCQSIVSGDEADALELLLLDYSGEALDGLPLWSTTAKWEAARCWRPSSSVEAGISNSVVTEGSSPNR
ncbi:LOW QUALITY PROTEIN: short-chain dehydrogenase/reductase [Colletotrichum tofieldiae]|nr:LOW QUALITY PROTEIN: short-chain dehydrogenase/reductase [Colletotrichum tofieldiae]